MRRACRPAASEGLFAAVGCWRGPLGPNMLPNVPLSPPFLALPIPLPLTLPLALPIPLPPPLPLALTIPLPPPLPAAPSPATPAADPSCWAPPKSEAAPLRGSGIPAVTVARAAGATPVSPFPAPSFPPPLCPSCPPSLVPPSPPLLAHSLLQPQRAQPSPGPVLPRPDLSSPL